MKITKAVIPVAGLGTRFLPASKAIPKEMMTIVDRPTIQYIVEEVVASGIQEIILVTREGKSAIENHFDRDPDLIQLSRHFVCIKVDALSRGDLMRAHRVDAFPTAVILDPAGAEAGRIEGYLPAARYLEAVKRTLPSNDRPDQSEVPEQ